MRVIHGIIHDGQIILDGGTQLPEGMEVQVLLVAPTVPTSGEASESEREEAFGRYLLATGVVSRLPTHEPYPPELDLTPIDIQGPPLSETVIRDRR